MTISLNELVNWLHITSFELSIHIIGIIFSLSIAVLWDEKILDILLQTNQREVILWWIFLPLWCADALVSYLNLVMLFRRIHYHKIVRQNLHHYGLRPDYLPPPPWLSLILDTTYKLIFDFCIFVFELFLFRKLVYSNQSSLTYSTVFSPLICVLSLVLLSICIKTCKNNGS
ncbi:unnamed protein product [Schistosoma turkestanicum]|nr:unnamed protein product [Schistosoma turkestanicum]